MEDRIKKIAKNEAREALGGYRLKQFTEADRKALLGEPKEWAVMDGSIVYSFYDRKEDAGNALRELVRDDMIAVRYGEWEDEIASEFNVDHDTIREIVKGQL